MVPRGGPTIDQRSRRYATSILPKSLRYVVWCPASNQSIGDMTRSRYSVFCNRSFPVTKDPPVCIESSCCTPHLFPHAIFASRVGSKSPGGSPAKSSSNMSANSFGSGCCAMLLVCRGGVSRMFSIVKLYIRSTSFKIGIFVCAEM